MLTWIVLRAAGAAAYVLLFASIAWGLIGTTNIGGRRIPRNTATLVHQFLSTGALLMLGVHVGGLLLDRFVPFRAADVLIPLHASFRPVAVAAGTLAMYGIVVVLVSSWLRKRVGTTWWRRLHGLAVPMFCLAMLHGVFAGTDTSRPWMWWTYVGTGAVIVFLMGVRGLTSQDRHRRAPPAIERVERPSLPTGTSEAMATR
jgi:sulfoxide reductase heme-binding subunit YedZ